MSSKATRPLFSSTNNNYKCVVKVIEFGAEFYLLGERPVDHGRFKGAVEGGISSCSFEGDLLRLLRVDAAVCCSVEHENIILEI